MRSQSLSIFFLIHHWVDSKKMGGLRRHRRLTKKQRIEKCCKKMARADISKCTKIMYKFGLRIHRLPIWQYFTIDKLDKFYERYVPDGYDYDYAFEYAYEHYNRPLIDMLFKYDVPRKIFTIIDAIRVDDRVIDDITRADMWYRVMKYLFIWAKKYPAYHDIIRKVLHLVPPGSVRNAQMRYGNRNTRLICTEEGFSNPYSSIFLDDGMDEKIVHRAMDLGYASIWESFSGEHVYKSHRIVRALLDDGSWQVGLDPTEYIYMISEKDCGRVTFPQWVIDKVMSRKNIVRYFPSDVIIVFFEYHEPKKKPWDTEDHQTLIKSS